MSQQSLGFTELSQKHTPKTVDVVAVHGLQGSAIKTWEHSNGKMWLKDFLSPDLPFARIMTFGYDSTVLLSKSVAEIEDKALELLNQLSLERTSLEPADSNGRPIVFIGHSLGGILVKKAIILAHERSDEPEYKDILDNTKGIAFLGTPHKGSDSAWWGAIVANIVKGLSIGTLTNSRLVSDLKKDSSSLGNISSQFVHRTKGIRMYTFYETKKTGSVVVVDKTSATMGLPNEKLFAVDADHRDICKFPSPESSAYKAVGSHVALLIKGALKPVETALSKEYSKCMRVLGPSNPDVTRYKISRPIPGTCSWLLDDPRYLEWINGSEKALLWVTGAPGSGKTVLSSFVIDQIESTKSPRNIGFFFADDSSTSQRSAVMLLRGLLYQILNHDPSLFKHAKVHWKRTAERTLEELSLLWSICIACFDDPSLENAVFVLDALDECAAPDCEHLLTWITQYQENRPAGLTQVKFFLTSRPEIRIADILDTSATRIRLEIHNDTDWLSKDIEVFIAVSIDTLPAMREWSSERKERIHHRLVQNADRTFLWVSLVLQKLTTEAMLSENAFTTMLSAVPDRLEDIYHSILMSIPSRYREAAKEMLSIIAMSQNPLSQAQLCECWAIQSRHLSVQDMMDDMEPDIRRTVGFLCGQIVRWEKAKPRLINSHRNRDSVERCRLVHQSAKDFLFSNPKMPMWYHLDLASAIRIITSKCVWFVNLQDFKKVPMDVDHEKVLDSMIVRPDVLRSKLQEYGKENPFHDYALHHWPHHFREYEQLKISSKSVVYDRTDRYDPTDYVATLYSHNLPLRAHWFMKMLRLADITLDHEECQISPILFCAYNGHASVMPKLMSQMDRPDLNAPMPQSKFSSLHVAVLGKHLDMVDWLLTNGANVHATDAWNRTPLHIAARRDNEDILRCLLDHHADISAKDSFGMTPIQGALERGFSKNVKILAQQSNNADPITPLIPDMDQTQDSQARHNHGENELDLEELDLEELDLEDPYQPPHDVDQEFADGYTGRIKDDGAHSLPNPVHTSGSSDSSERRSLSHFGSESSRNDSRRSLSRARSRNHITQSKHGSLRRSSSVGSYRGNTRARSLDLQFERDKERSYPPASLLRYSRIMRRPNSIDLNASVTDDVIKHRPMTKTKANRSLTTTKANRENELDSRPTILSMNGGSASSYSTLLILRELVKAIAKMEEDQSESETFDRPVNRPAVSTWSPPPIHYTLDIEGLIDDGGREKVGQILPCHYFDCIAGSSFGGLLAIMLGRLRMNINDCIHEYECLCIEMFQHRRAPLRSFFARTARKDRFDDRLRYIIKDIVHRRLPRKYGPKLTNLGASEEFAFDKGRCRTAVLVHECQPSDGPPAPSWIQSYNSPRMADVGFKKIPNSLPAWQVALASIVSPSHSHPVEIDGAQYQDIHSVRDIDLCAAACAEVTQSDVPIRRPNAVSIGPKNFERSDARGSKNKYFENHKLAGYTSNLHAAVSKYHSKKPYRYYRFKSSQNVHDRSDRSLSKIKAFRPRIAKKLSTSNQYLAKLLRVSDSREQIEKSNDESNETASSTDMPTTDDLGGSAQVHETLRFIIYSTEIYLSRDDVQTKISECAQTLVKRRRHRARNDLAGWRRECYGIRYQCIFEDCVGDDVEYADGQDLCFHFRQKHPHLDLFGDNLTSVLNDCMIVEL